MRGAFYRAGLWNSALLAALSLLFLTFSCFFLPPTPPLRVHHRHTMRTGASSQSWSTLPGRQQVLPPTHSSSPLALPPCQATSQGWPPTSPPGQWHPHPAEPVQPVSSGEGDFSRFWSWDLPKITKRPSLPSWALKEMLPCGWRSDGWLECWCSWVIWEEGWWNGKKAWQNLTYFNVK